MKLVKLHGTWVRVVPQPTGYLWLQAVPTQPKPEPASSAVSWRTTTTATTCSTRRRSATRHTTS